MQQRVRSLRWLFLVGVLVLGQAAAEEIGISVSPRMPTSSDTLYVNVTIPALCAPVIDDQGSEITMEGGTIRVSLATFATPHPCASFGESRTFEIGRLPAGEFMVQVEVAGIEEMPDIESEIEPVPVSVAGAGILERFGSGFDLSGLWWDSTDPGWSLMIEQMPDGNLVALFASYAEDGTNQWFMLLPGVWTEGYYVAPVAIAQNGPWFGRNPLPGQGLPPHLPSVDIVGEARISVRLGPDAMHSGGFIYTIEGSTTQRNLGRFSF